ncbi:hypothetical protein [Alkalihalobacillus sp. TS-13]|uniref:hypothetical protein n=1 Tax=Alkalihalobacillus sp. TS-13 TaxID=2842455 RepID=UPI001C877460|nr:hypothetical protein [Alkalihalobacillus sp. TS-13]
MWEKILGRFPTNLIIYSTIGSLLIPMVIYKFNQKLHDYADPPWKKHHGKKQPD